MTIARDGGGRWLPGGGSPNPAGRPALPAQLKQDLAAAAPGAVARLVELMASPDERIALLAAREILDRHMGRPAQAVEVEATDEARSVDIYHLHMRQAAIDAIAARHAAEDGDWSQVPTPILAEILDEVTEARKRGPERMT
jgi:hypothetical protein